MSRAQLTSTVEQNTGGAVAPFVAGKNALINGAMDIWARGTSFSGNAYMADRWFCANAQSSSGQESTIVPTGYRYSLKIISSASVPFISQPIETANSLQFAGQNAIFSAYVYTSVSATTVIDVQYSTSVDNPQSGSWTTITATSGGSAATSTSFTRVSGVFAIPSTAKSLNVRIYTLSNLTGNIYATGAQLELGSIATPFSRAGGTLQGELAACQRYYEKSYDQATAPGTSATPGAFYITQASDNAGNSVFNTRFKVEKRTNAYAMAYYTTTGTVSNWQYARSGVAATNAAVNNLYYGTGGFNAYVAVGVGWTANQVIGHWVCDNEL